MSGSSRSVLPLTIADLPPKWVEARRETFGYDDGAIIDEAIHDYHGEPPHQVISLYETHLNGETLYRAVIGSFAFLDGDADEHGITDTHPQNEDHAACAAWNWCKENVRDKWVWSTHTDARTDDTWVEIHFTDVDDFSAFEGWRRGEEVGP